MDPDRAAELFSAFGPVTVRRMFGGFGIYADGVMFALETRGALYLKSDAATDRDFEREGCDPFSYETRTGRRVVTSYRRPHARRSGRDGGLGAPFARNGALEEKHETYPLIETNTSSASVQSNACG